MFRFLYTEAANSSVNYIKPQVIRLAHHRASYGYFREQFVFLMNDAPRNYDYVTIAYKSI